MTSVCLDSYAVLCWLQDEPGAEQVEAYLEQAGDPEDETECFLSTVNLGEVYYRVARSQGAQQADEMWRQVEDQAVPITLVDATRTRIREAAAVKARHPIALGDAFVVQLARELHLPLMTGDPEILGIRDAEALDLVWLGS